MAIASSSDWPAGLKSMSGPSGRTSQGATSEQVWSSVATAHRAVSDERDTDDDEQRRENTEGDAPAEGVGEQARPDGAQRAEHPVDGPDEPEAGAFLFGCEYIEKPWEERGRPAQPDAECDDGEPGREPARKGDERD